MDRRPRQPGKKEKERPFRVRQGDRPPLPERIHFVGICGRMVGGMAMALRDLGVKVSGSDEFGFAAMPQELREKGISIVRGWSEENLPARVDAIVTGALAVRGNSELEAAMDRGVPCWNAASFLEHYFLRASLNHVVAGTKGKTTTTAMLAWILDKAGMSPDYVIGGKVRGALERVRLTGSPLAVLEGDEYCCGLGDPLAKFLRYHPRHLVVTNVSHDHADKFGTAALYRDAFRNLVDLVPRNGSVVLNVDDPGALALAGRTPTGVETTGFCRAATRGITRFEVRRGGTKFRLAGESFSIQVPGRMNALNASLAALSAAKSGVPLRDAAALLAEFPGVEGRQDVLQRAGSTIIYGDEANHPIAVRHLMECMKFHHPRQRLVVVFQPRSAGTRHGPYQRELPSGLAAADVAVVFPALESQPIPDGFDHKQFCRDLRRHGVKVHPVYALDEMIARTPARCRTGDVVVISLAMGNEAAAKELAGAIVRNI